MKKIIHVIFLFISISAMSQTDLPDPPTFKSASVVPESSPTIVSINWLPSDSLDVAGYIVYKIVDNITTTLDTVYGRNSTTYEYNQSQANLSSERYRLAAFDSLRYKSRITDPHSTIFLKSAYDKCEKSTTLTWTQYSGWGTGISNYRIYRKFNENSYQLIKTLSHSENSYSDTGLTEGRVYTYYVEAVNNLGYTATSNSIRFTASGHDGPAYIKANYASVDESNNIVLNFQIENSGQVVEYQLLRTTNPDSTYTPIASFTYSGQTQILYTDSDVQVEEFVYYYKLVSIDPCGNISQKSNIASNILLKVEANESTAHELEWTPYTEWTNGVFLYKIYSYYDRVSAEIESNSPGDLDHQQNISSYVKMCHDKGIYLTNTFCYYVEAYENSTNVTQQNISRSNIACIYESPVVWVPTAFNITSTEEMNRVYKPTMSFVKDYPYEFVIYDRWGQVVFKTNDVQEGWTGISVKDYYSTQYYIYTLKYTDYKNKEYKKTGTFYLLME